MVHKEALSCKNLIKMNSCLHKQKIALGGMENVSVRKN